VNVVADQDVCGLCVVERRVETPSEEGRRGAGRRRPATRGLRDQGPERAWAWKDTCVFSLWNQTGNQGSVRPILYVGIPPSEPSELL
jgi:hypothetical protein